MQSVQNQREDAVKSEEYSEDILGHFASQWRHFPACADQSKRPGHRKEEGQDAQGADVYTVVLLLLLLLLVGLPATGTDAYDGDEVGHPVHYACQDEHYHKAKVERPVGRDAAGRGGKQELTTWYLVLAPETPPISNEQSGSLLMLNSCVVVWIQ